MRKRIVATRVHGALQPWAILVAIGAQSAQAVPPLTQLPDTAACVNELGDDGCADGIALNLTVAVAVSPDGRDVYATAQISDGLVSFDRDPETGALTQKAGMSGCTTLSGTGGVCRLGVAFDGAWDVVMSPDGRTVYVTSVFSGSVSAFLRNQQTGAVSSAVNGCVSDDGSGGDCVDGTALDVTRGIAVSPDSRHVYVVAEGDGALAVFNRDTEGLLTQKALPSGCISDVVPGCAEAPELAGAYAVAVSPDGSNVYVAARLANAVSVFARNHDTGVLTSLAGALACVSETGGACTDGVALEEPVDVAVSPDGRNVYVASSASNGVAVFDRDLGTGALTQKAMLEACVSDDGSEGSCADGLALLGAASVSVSPDGKSVYVAAPTSNAVVSFDRDLGTGVLTQKTGVAACTIAGGAGSECVNGAGLVGAGGVVVSPDNRHVYVGMQLSDGVAAFHRDPAAYDIDGNGESEPLNDGLLLTRYLFEFTGETLIDGVVDEVGCTRCTALLIEAYIESLLGP